MKALYVGALACLCVISFASCKKCYECTTKQKVEYSDPELDDFAGVEQEYTKEKCGSKKDIEEYESDNTATATSTDAWGEYTSSATTTCVKQ